MAENIKEIISKNIAELRNIKGMTQIELAEKLNYSDKAVSKWERGESIPDITVLVEIAEIFGVSLDYLVLDKKEILAQKREEQKTKISNHGFITGISIVLVWAVATLIFVIIHSVLSNPKFDYIVFLVAVPVTLIVWLVFNSIWFNKRRNFLIISLLMWSVLASVYLSLLAFGSNQWLIFVLGAPAQIIILLWSKLKYKKK